MGFPTFLQGPEKQPLKITVLAGCSLESGVVIPYVIDPALQNWKHGLKCSDLVFVCPLTLHHRASPLEINQNAAIWWMSSPPNQNVKQISPLVSKCRSRQLFCHGCLQTGSGQSPAAWYTLSAHSVYGVVVWALWSATVKGKRWDLLYFGIATLKL